MSFSQDLQKKARRDRLVVESLSEHGRDIELVLDTSPMLFEDDPDAKTYFEHHLKRDWSALAARNSYRMRLQDINGPYVALLFTSLNTLPKVASMRDTLDRKDRERMNMDLSRAGLDGNGRFSSPVAGYVKALEVLSKNGIELDEVVSSHLFRYESLSITIDLARTNAEDPFSPVSLKNTMLALSWHLLAKGRYEVLAYLS